MTVPLASAGIMVQDSGLRLRDLDDVGLVGLGAGITVSPSEPFRAWVENIYAQNLP